MNNKVTREHTYEYWLKKYIEISNKIGRAVKYDEMSKYGLPSSRWMIKYCSNNRVTNFNEFIEFEAKMIPRYNMSKEKVIELILQMQKDLDRPLMKKDLGKISEGGIGQSIILKYWKSFNDMKIELGLSIVRESMIEKHKNLKDVKKDILKVCMYVYEKEHRDTITQKDWELVSDILSYGNCCKRLKEEGLNMREFISFIGFNYVESGSGLNYDFSDGEHIKSQYEMVFSRFLKENLNLKFNQDYFKEVRYETFVSEYKGLIDCDYVINYKDRKIFVEIAGMLRDYKKWFTNDIPIDNSKSKEKYRIKLTQKEKLLKDNNLDYYILFPSDIEEINKWFEENIINNKQRSEIKWGKSLELNILQKIRLN